MLFVSSGFPTHTETIELPRMEELLLNEFINYVYAEDVYKYGTELHKYLLDKTPISNKRKYVVVTSVVQFLVPEVSPVININKLDHEWHVDANTDYLVNGDETYACDYHLLISGHKLTSVTEFNENIIKIDVDNGEDINHYLNNEPSITKLISGREIDTNKIYTFDSKSIHKAKRSKQPEFRFFYRVIETNIEFPYYSRYENAIKHSYVYNGINKPQIKNIEKYHNSIIINTNRG